MSRLPRWAEEGATAEELRLLEASRRELPAPEARLRTLLALGVGGPSNGSPPSGGAPPSAAGAGRVGRVGSVGSVGSVGLTTKVALLIVCGGGAIVGAAWFATARRASVTPGVTTVSAGAPSAPSAPTIVPVPPSAPAAPEVAAATNAPAAVGASNELGRPIHVRPKRSFRSLPAPPARAPERAERTEAPVAASTLAAEVAALERAQTALAAHDAPGALRALDHYEAAFPSGRLVREETVLRVQALLARGDADAARALAERFFAAHPDSSYARRVRELLHDAREPRKKE